MPKVRRRLTSRLIRSFDAAWPCVVSAADADADSGMSSVDSWMVVIADAAKMEEKHASLAGIENEVEYASALQIRIALYLPDLYQPSCGSHSATHGRNHKPGRCKGFFSGLRNGLRKVMTVRDFKFAFLIAS